MAVTFGLTFVATRGDQTNVARYPNIEFLVHNFALWLGNLFFFFFCSRWRNSVGGTTCP